MIKDRRNISPSFGSANLGIVSSVSHLSANDFKGQEPGSNADIQFFQSPRSGEVYNIGGGRFSNASMMESIRICEEVAGRRLNHSYQDDSRTGDHIWWVSDTSKFSRHYPGWKQRYDVPAILQQICENNLDRWAVEVGACR